MQLAYVKNTAWQVVGGTTTTYAWDYLNRMIQWAKTGATTENYLYNAVGMRVRKTPSGGAATDFLLDGKEIAEEITGSSVTSYVGPGTISRISGEVRAIYHADGLGSTRAMSGDSAVVTESAVYAAYGSVLVSSGTVPSFGFVGQHRYYSEQIGQYLKYRYYHEVAGRFLSTDPIGYKGGLNLYTYANNDPIDRVDPWGMQSGRPDPKEPYDILCKMWKCAQDMAEQASDEAEGSGWPGPHGGPQDALRHCIWSCKMQVHCPAGTAWGAGLGHEVQRPGPGIWMDLGNNTAGRRCGNSIKAGSNQSCLECCMSDDIDWGEW